MDVDIHSWLFYMKKEEANPFEIEVNIYRATRILFEETVIFSVTTENCKSRKLRNIWRNKLDRKILFVWKLNNFCSIIHFLDSSTATRFAPFPVLLWRWCTYFFRYALEPFDHREALTNRGLCEQIFRHSYGFESRWQISKRPKVLIVSNIHPEHKILL